MNKPPDDFDIDDDIISQLNMVLYVSASKLLNHVSADDYLNWARTSLPALAPSMFTIIPPTDIDRFAYWIGANIWNSAPQPSNDFKPIPLDKPSRNTPCPCGSTLKYKQCCILLEDLPVIHGDMMWPFFYKAASKNTLNNMLQQNNIPVIGLLLMADYCFEDNDFAQTIKILAPLFADNAPRLNKNHRGALDTLCDSYNAHYKTDKKKQDLLQRMCQHHSAAIRAEAWQRLASWRQDSGDISGARLALSEAMRAEPDNPSHCLLELTLLVDSNEIELARQRAKFWLRKMQRHQDEYPDIIDILTQAQSDPVRALQQAGGHNPRLEQLQDWLSMLETRKIPTYVISHHMAPEIEKQIDLFDDADDETPPELDPMTNAGTIEAPEAILLLEQTWHSIAPIDKPFSTQEADFDHKGAWSDEDNNEWLDFLLKAPQSADSLDILDDVATLMLIHPDNDYPWGPINQLQPLLERARLIVEQADNDHDLKLPWLIMENRSALRLLKHSITMALDKRQQEKATRLMQQYIKLNPSDNHGYRSLLINHYLQQGQDQQALELCRHYPDDMMAETRYGKTLALYRLGHLDKAKNSLLQAHEALPLVADYLIKSRVKKPRIDEYGYTYGGADQAWLYRDDMRETWRASAGAIKWLKQQL